MDTLSESQTRERLSCLHKKDVKKVVRLMSFLISMIAAEMTATLAFVLVRSPVLGMLLLSAGIVSALQWLKLRRRLLEDEALAELCEARAHLQAGRHWAARDVARTVAASACSPATHNRALHILAWAALGDSDPVAARRVLEALRPEAVDAYTLAAVESANGCSDRAIEALDCGRRRSGLNRDAARFLVDLHAQVGDFKRVAATTIELSNVLGPEDVQTVGRALTEAGELHLAVGVMGVLSRPIEQPHSRSSVPALGKPILRK